VGGVAFECVRMPVEPGDRLVMCTDGLVEVRGEDIGTGLATLCESAAHPAASMDDACDTVVRALAASAWKEGRGGRKDDVALLMARLNGIAERDVAQWELTLEPREVGRARRLVRRQLAAWGLEEAAESAELLVSEIVTNAVRHGQTHTDSRRGALRLVRGDGLLCEVTDDDGHALPALTSAGPDDEAGRGLAVVSSVAREWGANRTGEGKTVWFELALG
jgi:anti-sigma regulatory factor (Ser/Thr protein kinase)